MARHVTRRCESLVRGRLLWVVKIYAPNERTRWFKQQLVVDSVCHNLLIQLWMSSKRIFQKIGLKQNYFEDGHEQKFLNQITDFTQ